ncbi:ATP-binding cassette domain-containing protein [Schinkia sp. CFF1]
MFIKKWGGTPLLQNINLEIKKGQHTAIIGHNGSGKSSLLKLIAGIYEPTSGIIIRGSQRIAYVPEHFPSHLRFKMKEYLTLMLIKIFRF